MEQMASARTSKKDFAVGGYLETFGDALSGFDASGTAHTGSLSLKSPGASARAQYGL
jgi:hypothetical protein